VRTEPSRELRRHDSQHHTHTRSLAPRAGGPQALHPILHRPPSRWPRRTARRLRRRRRDDDAFPLTTRGGGGRLALAGRGRGPHRLPQRRRCLRRRTAPRYRHRGLDRRPRPRRDGRDRPVRRVARGLGTDGLDPHGRRALRHLVPPSVGDRRTPRRRCRSGRADRSGRGDRPALGGAASSALRGAPGRHGSRLPRPARAAGPAAGRGAGGLPGGASARKRGPRGSSGRGGARPGRLGAGRGTGGGARRGPRSAGGDPDRRRGRSGREARKRGDAGGVSRDAGRGEARPGLRLGRDGNPAHRRRAGRGPNRGLARGRGSPFIRGSRRSGARGSSDCAGSTPTPGSPPWCEVARTCARRLLAAVRGGPVTGPLALREQRCQTRRSGARRGAGRGGRGSCVEPAERRSAPVAAAPRRWARDGVACRGGRGAGPARRRWGSAQIATRPAWLNLAGRGRCRRGRAPGGARHRPDRSTGGGTVPAGPDR